MQRCLTLLHLACIEIYYSTCGLLACSLYPKHAICAQAAPLVGYVRLAYRVSDHWQKSSLLLVHHIRTCTSPQESVQFPICTCRPLQNHSLVSAPYQSVSSQASQSMAGHPSHLVLCFLPLHAAAICFAPPALRRHAMYSV